MTFLSGGIIPFTCAICSAKFNELAGGRCSKCGKIVCQHHFFKGWLKGQNRVCSKCLEPSNVGPSESKHGK